MAATLSYSRVTRRELGVAATLLLLLGAVAYGPHVLHGNFTVDDWSHAASVKHTGGIFSHYWSFTSNRPVLVVYVPLTHLVFGANPWIHHAWSVVLATGMSAALYAVFRRLGLERRHAGAIAALVLLFPMSDAARLWATASHIHLGITFGLVGVLVALRGLDAAQAGDTKRARWLHAGAVALYALSVLTYEIAGAALLLVGGLYLLRAPWGTIRARWAADVLSVVACLAWSGIRAKRDVRTLQETLDHARDLADQSITVFARSALPFGSVGRDTILVLLLAALAGAAAVWRLLPSYDEARATLGRWLVIAGVGFVMALAGWVMYIPADPYYSLDAPGVGNRTNVLAAIGVVTVVYAVAVLVAVMLLRGISEWSRRAGALATGLALVLAIGYLDDLRRDERAWRGAGEGADEVLTVLSRTVPDPPAGSTLYTFGYPGSETWGVVIFAFTWDLNGAVQLRFDDPSVSAYPIVEPTVMECRADGVAPVGPGWIPESQGAAYGKALFVDVPGVVAQRIESEAECRAALGRFRPGPLLRLPS